MQRKRSSFQQEQILWRRDQVKLFHSKGMGVRKIAGKLQVDPATVSRDLGQINKGARHRIDKYIEEEFATEYDSTLTCLNAIIENQWEVAETTENNRERTMALALVKECAIAKMEMIGQAKLVDRTINIVRKHRSLTIKHKKTDVLAQLSSTEESINIPPKDQN